MYNKKKRAFVSDFFRFYILYKEWWIYLDTDMELIKNIDNFLKHKFFIWFQDIFSVGWWIIWAEQWNKILKEFISFF